MGLGEISAWMVGMKDTIAETKEVVYRPSTATDTVRVGDLVCYNSDLAADYKEKTSNPSDGGTTYAEGSQTYTGRLLIVEKPASTNLHQWAGVVASLGRKAGADGDLLQIFVPKDGAVVPVMCDKSVTRGETVLAVKMDQYEATSPVYGGSTASFRVIGLAEETVDRSSTDGLVWMRMSTSGIFGVTGGCGGVSANQVTLSAGQTEGQLLGHFLAVKSTQTGGDASALRVRMDAAGAGMNIGLGAIRAEGVVDANIAHTASYDVDACAVSAHLICKTGCTPAASTWLTGLYAKLENQDSTPADLANASVCALTCVLQNDDAPTLSAQMRFVSQGSDDPDVWFKADDAGAIAAQTADTTFTPNYGGTIKIQIGSTDYYIPFLSDLD